MALCILCDGTFRHYASHHRCYKMHPSSRPTTESIDTAEDQIARILMPPGRCRGARQDGRLRSGKGTGQKHQYTTKSSRCELIAVDNSSLDNLLCTEADFVSFRTSVHL
jgi:hypothetical protein